MPLYEYQCQSCDHRFERIQKFSDDPVRECPSCGAEVEKLISSPAIRFKGSGFYITDYAKPESGETSGADKSSGKDSDKTDSGKKDTKKEDKGGTTSDASASKSKEGTSKNQGTSAAGKSGSSKPS
jgi:putative FmdB family regulatory protein